MPVSELWALGMVLAAFAGGAFGAAVGALPAFTMTGVLVLLGETLRIVRAQLGGTEVGGAVASVPITGELGFGVAFGPHVAFGGGAAALAYASKRGYLDADSGFVYHEAKHVTRGLGTRPDVLLVGGVFGVLGYWVATLSLSFSLPWDPVAMGVVASALLHRAALGYSIVGDVRGSILDMSPFEREERRHEEFVADGGSRYLVEPWLPYQYEWPGVATLGVVVGILGAYVAYVTASPFLAFGVSVTLLVFVNAGVEAVPVTHHISLPASTAVLAFVPAASSGMATPSAVAAALPLWQALLLGAGFGLVGALAGELLQRIFYAHAETHLDPPAASIVVTSLLIAVLAMAGVLPHSVWVPHP